MIVVLDGYTLSSAKPDSTPPSGEPSWHALSTFGKLIVYDRTPPGQVLDRIADADIVLTNKTPLTADTLRHAASLRYVGVMATGVDIVNLDVAAEQGIVVSNAPAYSTESVAQHTFALLLDLVNQVAAHDHSVHAGGWTRCEDFSYTVTPLVELARKNLGIVGLGTIGRRVALVGHAMGMNILAANQRSMHQIELPGVDIHWMPVDDLVEQADVLTLHCPLSAQTKGLINSDRLNRMKPTSYLVNSSRGPLVDEHALADALRAGTIAGAALDVLTQEPPRESPLLDVPNCVITPHIAWATRESRHRLMDIIVNNVKAFCAGQPVNQVTR